MASNPLQFHLEDQTDEDFFDNLVNEEDDFGASTKTAATATTTHKFAANDSITVDSNDSDSDDAKAFANLSIDDSGIDSKQNIGAEFISEKKNDVNYLKQNIGTVSIAENENEWDDSVKKIGSNSIPDNKRELSAASAIEPSNMSDIKDVLGLESVTDSVDKSSGSVVKEVGWSSFCADSTEKNGNHRFGSYSDFFPDLGENPVEFPGKVEENLNVAPNANGGVNQESKSDGVMQNSIDYGNYGQYQESQIYGAEEKANGIDLNSSEYWETLYPGWKYDVNTGQWYQVDVMSSQQGCPDAASGSDWNVISEISEVSYLNQSDPSVVRSVMTTSTTERVSNWNSEVSQGDKNGHPEHLIFDPQYPDWYYDAIAQEWHLLEDYNSSQESTVQARGKQSQNGLYGEFSQGDNYSSKHDGRQSLHDKQADNYGSRGLGNLSQHGGWAESYGDYSCNHQGFNMWQPESVASAMAVSNLGQNQHVDNLHGSNVSVNSHVDQPNTFSSMQSIPSYDHARQGHGQANGISGFQSFVPSSGDFNKQYNQAYLKQNEQMQRSNDLYGSQKHDSAMQQSFIGYQNSYAPNIGRSSAGRPPHALVTFGFGGKLIVMKDNNSLLNSAYGSQGHAGGSISVLNMMEVVMGNTDASGTGGCGYDYFRALCRQSFPGPLVGGNVGSRELNKWIDERIANCESPGMDYRKGEILKLLLSLLKIACQHYGKLRSPFGTDTTLRENDTPESAVAKLFASAKRNGTQYGGLNQCLLNLPSEAQIRATASEVQNLLVSGRKKEALLFAQDGQLWGPALILASQLGEQFYIDTVKQMALRQLVAGSPLRTLCLLIAGQPADVFSTDMLADRGLPRAVNMSQQSTPFGANGMLDDWEENLAVITANRTNDDELVIIHLGDCLWKDRSEITAAHICYLVAEANFESYSDTARLCLIGADHWKFPRTYACPEAIQRTELYEYSKVLGNSQFILLPFQPYKLIYAFMLAEVGKVSDSLKYCQALLKSLKTGRATEVETLKQLVLSLDERIRIHQQGGYTANLAPGKLVGKLLNFFDSTAHRVVGSLPPLPPSTFQGNGQSNEMYNQPVGPRVSSSQSTMAMSSLMPSTSMEPIRAWAADGNQMTISNRSASEPDIGRTPRQVDSSMEATSSSAEGKASGSGGISRSSRFGFGSGLLQKTVGLVLRPRSDKKAKLGEKNKFYYDEKLKRWVEEGAEPPPEETTLPPPPPTAAFQNGMSDYKLQSALKSDSSSSNGGPIIESPTPEHTSGVPLIPNSTNQFSARGRMGVRSRYVDTFNQGKGSPAKSFQSLSVPSAKHAATGKAKFFVPAPISSAEQPVEAIVENAQEENATYEKPSTSTMNDSIQSPASSITKQRFPSMNNIPSGFMTNDNSSHSIHAHPRRTASWSGSLTDAFNLNMTETSTLGEALGMPPSSFIPSPVNGRSFGDELHEVEL